MAELNTIITLRQGTTEEWNRSTVVLKSGEMGLEYREDGSVKIKAGDNEHLWGDLLYIDSDVEEAKVFQVELTADDVDDIAAIERVVNGQKKQSGDIAIVKSTFADGKISYTSFVYEAELDVEDNLSCGWSAMDGNYSASNVFLKNEITLAGDFEKVGNMSKGDTVAAGTSLESLFDSILQQELNPEATLPTASISVSGGNGEVGSSYTLPTATLTIDSVGSYTYGPATGITFDIDAVELKQGSNSKKNTSVMAAGSTLKLQATDTETLYTDTAKKYTFTATASHTEGAVPVTNLGNEDADAKIAAGDITVESKSASFTGWRKIFGSGTTAATLDSANIRALTYLKKSSDTVPTKSGGQGIVFKAVKGDTKVVFAYPASWTTKTPKFEIFTMAWGATEGFVESTVQVADYRGGENGLKDYKVFTYTPATPLAADETQYCVYFA